MIARFLEFELDEAQREFRNGDGPIPMEPKTFDLIVHLLRHRDRVVRKEELLNTLWPGQEVFEGVLATCVYRARQACGGGERGQRVIRNVPRVGYRFVAEVLEIRDSRSTRSRA